MDTQGLRGQYRSYRALRQPLSGFDDLSRPLVALFAKRLPERSVDFSLAFAAGITLVARFTSLIIPAIEYSGSFFPQGTGILPGVLMIYAIDCYVPHEHLYKGFEGPKGMKEKLKLAWLLIIAVIYTIYRRVWPLEHP